MKKDKTILIIGDSWGVPNYEGPQHGDDPDTHTEYRLRQLGYKVYNCAINGGSNCRSIDLARAYLNGEKITLEPVNLNNTYHKNNEPGYIDVVNPKIDWIVWFHTEVFRGRYYKPWKTIDENILNAHNDYKNAADFFSTLNAKVAIIGGQAPVLTDILSLYIKPDFMIEDWRSDIIGKKLPPIYTFTHVEWIEKSPDTIEYKNNLLAKHKIIMDAMRDSKDFPDNCHPGSEAHKSLTNKLHEVFQGSI